MMWKTALAISLSMATLPAALAQAVYRSVDADGKVVYSDQPPTGTNAAYKVIKPNNTKATVTAPEASSTAAADEPRAASKQALPKQASTAAAAAPEKLNPAVERAVIRVMANDELIRQAEALCSGAAPASQHNFHEPATAWRERNGGTLLQQRRVVNEVLQPAQRQLLEQLVTARVQGQLAVVQNASAASKAKWCNSAFAEVERGDMDVQNRSEINDVLTTMRRR